VNVGIFSYTIIWYIYDNHFSQAKGLAKIYFIILWENLLEALRTFFFKKKEKKKRRGKESIRQS
jgi:hypothetical protein